MNAAPNFGELVAIGTIAAEKLQDLRNDLAAGLRRIEDPYWQAMGYTRRKEIKTFRARANQVIAVLRYVARHDLSLVACQVAIWRDKGRAQHHGMPYVDFLMRRAAEVEGARRAGRPAVTPGRAA